MFFGWRTALRAARGKVSPDGLREGPDRDLLADTELCLASPTHAPDRGKNVVGGKQIPATGPGWPSRVPPV